MKHLLRINEDGESSGMAVAGMGDIVSAQPSIFPGDVAGSTIGSGDIGVTLGATPKKQPLEMGKNHGPRTGKKTREKRVDIKAMKSALRDRKNAKPTGKIMSFDNFGKTTVDKVVKVNDLSKVSENSTEDLTKWLIGQEVVITKEDDSCVCGIAIYAKEVYQDDKCIIKVTIVDEGGDNQSGYYKNVA